MDAQTRRYMFGWIAGIVAFFLGCVALLGYFATAERRFEQRLSVREAEIEADRRLDSYTLGDGP